MSEGVPKQPEIELAPTQAVTPEQKPQAPVQADPAPKPTVVPQKVEEQEDDGKDRISVTDALIEINNFFKTERNTLFFGVKEISNATNLNRNHVKNALEILEQMDLLKSHMVSGQPGYIYVGYTGYDEVQE